MAALVLRNRVKETTASTGTGALATSGAVRSFRGFAAAGLTAGMSFPYAIETPSGAWENGTATMQAGGTIARAVEDSSTGALLNLAGEVGTTIALVTTANFLSTASAPVENSYAGGAIAPTDDIAILTAAGAYSLANGQAPHTIKIRAIGAGLYTLSVTIDGNSQSVTLSAPPNVGGGIELRWNTSATSWLSMSLLGPSARVVVPAAPVAPVPGMLLTLDYLPPRDGPALLSHGSGADMLAGYAANAAANPNAIWLPRQTSTTAAAGDADIYSGCASMNVDPEGPLGATFNPFTIVGSALRIRAQRSADFTFAAGVVPNDPATGAAYAWLTGALSSKDRFAQQGGYWEMDAQLPHATGAWGAFWLLPLAGPHPPEIDVVEYVSQDPPGTYQRNAISLGAVAHSLGIATGVNLSLASHKYGVWITDSLITFYFDGTAVGSVDISAMFEFGQLFYCLVVNQIGSRLANWVPLPDATTPSPMDLLLYSLRAWQLPGPTGITLSSLTYLSNLAAGATVATIGMSSFGNSTGLVASILLDPDSAYVVVGTALNLRAASTGTSHSVTLVATDAQGRTWKHRFAMVVILATPTQPNLLPSQNFTDANWVRERVGATATSLTETVDNNTHDVLVAAPVKKTTASRYRFAGDYTPIGGLPWIVVQIFGNNTGTTNYGNNAVAWFNVAGAAAGYVAGNGVWSNVTAVVTTLPNGAVRCQVDFTTSTTTEDGMIPLVRLARGQDQSSYAGDPALGMTIQNLVLYDPAA